MYRTNIEIDQQLVKEAMQLYKIKTKKEAVNFALRELVQKTHRKNMLRLEGKIDWAGDLDEMRTNRT